MRIHVRADRGGARLGSALVAAVAVGGVSLMGAVPASAAPGDSGVIRIHAAGVPAANTSDAPKVCSFNLSAVNFQTVPSVTYTISPLPKAAGKPTLTGQLALKQGKGATPDTALPDGTYQLSWTFPGGVPKQKTFKVNCGGASDAKPQGPVSAGGGGVPPIGGAGGGHSTAGPLLAATALGTAALFAVRWARRRMPSAA